MNTGRRIGLGAALVGATLVVAASLPTASWRGESATTQAGAGARIAPAVSGAAPGGMQEPVPERHTVEVVARRYAFTPARIEVRENDLVKIVFSTGDIPHSFTIDEYRIAKRAAPGRPVTFEFRADKSGTFAFYCNLTTEEGCKKMRGELVVRPR